MPHSPAPSTPKAPRSLLGQYFEFLRVPTKGQSAGGVKRIIRQVWRLYSFHLVLLFPMVLVIQVLSQWIVSIKDHQVGEALKNMEPWQFMFLAVVLAPVLEEIIFRLPLRFSRLNWNVPLGMILFVLIGSLVQEIENSGMSRTGGWLSLGMGLVLGLMVWVNLVPTLASRFFTRHLRGLIYLSSALFGIVHFTNYPREAWIVTPFLVLPQATLGLLLAYVRIRFGFVWAILTHALHNFLLTSPLLLTFLGSDQLRQQIFDQTPDVEMLPADMAVTAISGLWFLGVLTVVIITAVRLIQEWRRERAATSL